MNLKRPFNSWASDNKRSRSTRSILFIMSATGWLMLGNFCKIASTSSSIPRRTSIRRATNSASPAPLHADVTMARSRRRFGAKMPGVSTKMICELPSIAIPRTSVRVVCTFRETIETFEPTRRLISVDLPAFGAPIRATKPQRVSASGGLISSVIYFWPSGLINFKKADAAACSATRFEGPEPCVSAKPSTMAAISKTGAWSGPERPVSR